MTNPNQTPSTHSDGNRAELIMGVVIISLIFAVLMVWVGWSIRTKKAELSAQIQE